MNTNTNTSSNYRLEEARKKLEDVRNRTAENNQVRREKLAREKELLKANKEWVNESHLEFLELLKNAENTIGSTII